MNLPSLDKFEESAHSGGNIIVNSSLISKKVARDDVNVYYVPANEIASELGNLKTANMVILGAYLEITHSVKTESLAKALEKVFGASKSHLIPINKEALKLGAEAVRA